MEITKENVATLLVQQGVIPQALVDGLDGDGDFLNTLDIVVGLAGIGKLLLDTDDHKRLLTFAISVFVMGPDEGKQVCRMAGVLRDIGGTPDDVYAFIGKLAQKAAAGKLAETVISKAATH